MQNATPKPSSEPPKAGRVWLRRFPVVPMLYGAMLWPVWQVSARYQGPTRQACFSSKARNDLIGIIDAQTAASYSFRHALTILMTVGLVGCVALWMTKRPTLAFALTMLVIAVPGAKTAEEASWVVMSKSANVDYVEVWDGGDYCAGFEIER